MKSCQYCNGEVEFGSRIHGHLVDILLYMCTNPECKHTLLGEELRHNITWSTGEKIDGRKSEHHSRD